ncbi:CerR family C-terminal domain-containing protein [soil metagenome]
MARANRNQRSDGVATRARILESAGQLFERHGFAATESKAVAEHAGVDTASINYHFGGRDGLYRAVLAEAHDRFIGLEDLARIARDDLAPEERLEALIAMLVERISSQAGWGWVLLSREVLTPSGHLAAALKQESLPKVDILLQIISEITGIPGSDPVIFCCLVSVIAPCAMLLLTRNEPLPLNDPLNRMPLEQLTGHFQRFALAGLNAAALDYAQRRGERR